ncbi:helix-turn-helix domain-containing protein [Pseudooceanicola sp. 200-1SW]|uniref:helix-turn-helix domain-containing protein n=1 Tax=Pseudooceanicola sp. 200-1SW TaxID=3425949 RepID=UPI003D7F4DEC
MDDKWFKAQQKKVGITAEDIAARLGRDRSAVSKIYTGQRRMTLEWAQAFSEALDVPIDEVLRRAGLIMETSSATPIDETPELIATPPKLGGKPFLQANHARAIRQGMVQGDAAPFSGNLKETETANRVADAFGRKHGQELWTVTSEAMKLGGYLQGDTLLLDTDQSERCGSGDIVLAQIHDWGEGSPKIALRRFEPPALIADSASETDRRLHLVDGRNVVIRGKVVASWRP